MREEDKETWAYQALRFWGMWAELSRHPATRFGMFFWWFFTGETFQRVHDKFMPGVYKRVERSFDEGMVTDDWEPIKKGNTPTSDRLTSE